MKMRTDECDPTLVSRFYDGELGPERHDRVRAHIKRCPQCGKMLEELKTLSEHVKTYIIGDQLKSRSISLEDRVVDKIRKEDSAPWEKIRSALSLKRTWIPAVAIASLALVFFTLLRTPGIPGPSAIITSLSGDTTSVIIMETPDTGHTILWFTEAS